MSVLVLALCVIAFALRIALAHGNLWGDEAESVVLSFRPLEFIIRTLTDALAHGPLHPLILKVWMRLAGTQEVAVRLPSVAAATALVPLAAVAGRSIGPRVGPIAALLVAINPFLTWYGIDATIYALTALLAAASCVLYARFVERPTNWRAIAWGVAAGAALLTHYFVVFLLGAQALTSLLLVIRRPALIRPLALAVALGLVVPALWILAALRVLTTYQQAVPGTVDLPAKLMSALTRIAAGWAVTPEQALAVGVGGALLALIGSVAGWRHRVVRLCTAWLVIPALVGIGVSAIRPAYQERYLIVVAVPYLLLVATAIASARLVPRAVLVAAVTVAAAVPSWNMFEGRYAKSAYASLTAELNSLGQRSDAVVLASPSQGPLYEYYASRDGRGLEVFPRPRSVPADPMEEAEELGRIAAEHDAIWLLLYAEHDYDPADVVERWLTAHSYRAPPRQTVNGSLIRFATERAVRLGAPVRRDLGGGWTLEARLGTGRVSAGGLLPLEVRLTSLEVPSATPRLRLRLLDERGFIWGEAAESLGFGLDPPTGDTLERRAVALVTGAPDGVLKVEAALYLEEPDGARSIGSAQLGTVEATSSDRFWPGELLGFRPTSGVAVGGWELLGWAGAARVEAGQRAYLTTAWRAMSDGLAAEAAVGFGEHVVPVRLEAAAVGTVRRVQIAPAVGRRWTPGAYPIRVGDGNGWHSLGSLIVDPGPPIPPAASPTVVVDAIFGEAIRLRGYTLEDRALTLHWESLRAVDRPYDVFVHVLDGSGGIVAQSDGQPDSGRAPTDAWAPADLVDDRRDLSAPAGVFEIAVGLYDAASGRRLELRGGGDALRLGAVRIRG